MNYYIVLSVIAVQDATNERITFSHRMSGMQNTLFILLGKKKREIIKIRSCESFEVPGAQ